jgi:hypothetical protein
MSTMSTISDLLAALGPQLATERDAYGIAHDLGHALPSLDDAALRELRNALVQAEPADPRVGVVVATLVEIVDGYRLGRRQTITIALPDGVNREVLCALERRASTTSELAQALSRDESQISRALARLRELDLLDPPQREAVDRRRIEHRLSLSAKQALGHLDQRARKAPVWQLSAFEPLEERSVLGDELPVTDDLTLRDPAGAVIATAPPPAARAAASRAKALGVMPPRTKAPGPMPAPARAAGLMPSYAKTPGLTPTRAKAPPSYVPASQRRERTAPGATQPFVTLDKLPRKGK